MGLQFGQLKVEEKVFSRKDSKPRGQNYEGIKFRRFDSEKDGKKATEEKFTISDKLWEKLNLEKLALAQASFGGVTYLLVVEDQDEVKPEATMARLRKKEDGTILKKGHTFGSEFLVSELTTEGILSGDKGNQFLAMTDVTKDVEGLPSVVKGVYTFSVDSSVKAEDNQEEEAAPVEAKEDF